MSTRLATAMLVAAALMAPRLAVAGCGCDKPPPPRAAVRPFVAHGGQAVTLFADALVVGRTYPVDFVSAADGVPVRAEGRVRLKRDLADGAPRAQLRVALPDLPLGPCTIRVLGASDVAILTVAADGFTVAGRPVALADVEATVQVPDYRAGVGADGTVYIPVDVAAVDGATRFWGAGIDFPLAFQADNVAIYNDQGFLMQLLDPSVPGLFELYGQDGTTSSVLGYWRHEFRTYKARHLLEHAWFPDDRDPDWHADGTRHVDHDHLVVAIRGRFADGGTPEPGATQPFQLVILSVPEER